MNIYDCTTQNDPLATYITFAGINFADKSCEFINMSTEECLENILTWGCMEPDSKITFVKVQNQTQQEQEESEWDDFYHENVENYIKTRKVDLKNKVQWLS